MKKSSLIGGVFVFLLGIMLGGWLTWKFKPLPQGMVAVPQETVDSLEAYKSLTDSLQVIADLPPDTVKVDSIVYVKEIKYVETTPTVELDTLGLLQYADTLFVEDEVNAWVKFKVRGFVKGNLEWGYQPIIKEIETTVEKKIPYPVLTNVEVPVPSTGNYLSLAAGGNDKMFIFGVDYDLVKTDYVYGLQYRRWGGQNVYGIKLGVNLNTLFKRIKNGP